MLTDPHGSHHVFGDGVYTPKRAPLPIGAIDELLFANVCTNAVEDLQLQFDAG